MAMSRGEIIRWLDTLPNGSIIGIDKGGLSLQAWGQEAYLEIGGLPDEDEDDEEGTMDEEKLISYKENIEDHKCPYCGSDSLIEYSNIEIDAETAIQRATCKDCEKSWREIYNFKAVVLDDLLDEEGLSPIIEF